jgi:hypothetical protein
VRPYGGGFPSDPYRALATASRALDIEGGRADTGVAQPTVVALIAAAVVASLALAVVTHRRQQAAATALLLAPLCVPRCPSDLP